MRLIERERTGRRRQTYHARFWGISEAVVLTDTLKNFRTIRQLDRIRYLKTAFECVTLSEFGIKAVYLMEKRAHTVACS